MPYMKLLRRIISNTNYTNAEILRKCEELGQPINKTYFSNITNGRKPAPSEEKSRTLAKVLNIDERLLVIEGYIDKAPKEIKKSFQNILLMENLSATKCLELLDKNKLHTLQKYFENEPLSEMIIDILDNSQNCINFLEKDFHIEKLGNGEEISINLNKPVGIEIQDNAMAPKIEKGDKVLFDIVENNYNYKNTDILLVKTKQNPEIRVRNVIKINHTIQLQGYSQEYIEPPCNKEDLLILGKVTNVIKKI